MVLGLDYQAGIEVVQEQEAVAAAPEGEEVEEAAAAPAVEEKEA